MELGEKLQQLRKQRGLTQEELAECLFVSRTAISKWESGRGYPNIDSLKSIAGFFSVTVDELLSGEELLTIAEADAKEKQNHFRDLIFGLLDLSTVIFFFLPFCRQNQTGVSLPELTQLQPWLKISYISLVAAMILLGIVTLTLQNCRHSVWMQSKGKLSLFLHCATTLLFILGLQPYAAAFLFIFLAIKALMMLKFH